MTSGENRPLEELSRVTWTTLPDIPRLSGPTMPCAGRWFFQYSPTSILKLDTDDGEGIMTAFAHSILGTCVPRVLEVVTLSPEAVEGRPPPRVLTGLVLTHQSGRPLEELWPSLSPAQRHTVKLRLCGVILRMRGAGPFDYYGRPSRKPYAISFFRGPKTYACCASRVEWDESRIAALRASNTVPAERIPALERAQRETSGADGWDRAVLTHGDLSDRNILVDPSTLEITGLIDWETANIMPAYFEYVAARLCGGHEPAWRKELLDVLRMVLRRECGMPLFEGEQERTLHGESSRASDGERKYRETLGAWDTMVDVERFAQEYNDDCYWTFETGLLDSVQQEGSALH